MNLRKAFLSGTMDDEAEEVNEGKHHRVEKLLHEFCKMFGRTGVPECTSGVLSFPDFLEVKMSTCSDEYYRACSEVRLHRQVGK